MVLVEAGRIDHGFTAQSTVKATLGPGMMLGHIARLHGEGVASSYVSFNRGGLQDFVGFAQELEGSSADCALTEGPHTFYAVNRADGERLAEEAELAQRSGALLRPADPALVPMPAAEAVAFAESYTFHPATYLAGLAELA